MKKINWDNVLHWSTAIGVIGLVLFILFGIIGQANATDGDCNTYRNHSGNVPDRYDYAEFFERGYGWFGPIEVPDGGLSYPPPEGRRSWDKVKKCTRPQVTTTTGPEPTTTTTTTIITTTTTPTTTVPPSTTTTVAPTTTSSSTTTTVVETTTTSLPPSTTTVPVEESTTTTTVTVTTTTKPPELPNTGLNLMAFAIAAGIFLLAGAAFIGLSKEDR